MLQRHKIALLAIWGVIFRYKSGEMCHKVGNKFLVGGLSHNTTTTDILAFSI